jgi:hypothetical protein
MGKWKKNNTCCCHKTTIKMPSKEGINGRKKKRTLKVPDGYRIARHGHGFIRVDKVRADQSNVVESNDVSTEVSRVDTNTIANRSTSTKRSAIRRTKNGAVMHAAAEKIGAAQSDSCIRGNSTSRYVIFGIVEDVKQT